MAYFPTFCERVIILLALSLLVFLKDVQTFSTNKLEENTAALICQH